jgi:hypothetical protein
MLRMVSVEEWDLSKLPDAVRRQRLLHPPSAECLLTRLINEATSAAENGKLCLNLEPCETPGYSEYSRLQTQIPVNKCTYDLLFNGRSGYRAQYYLSPEEGNTYNRQIIDDLIPVLIRTAGGQKAENSVDPDLVQLSLKSMSKLAWYGSYKDALIFYRCPKTLSVPRWNDYWNSKPSCWPMGLIAFMLDNPRVFLKGAFVDPNRGDIYDNKPDRANDLHKRGWT